MGLFMEVLAALEHEQWMAWSKDIAKTEVISKERLARWRRLWVPYSELTEEDKELDRQWARRVCIVAVSFGRGKPGE